MFPIARALTFVILLPGAFGALVGIAAAIPGNPTPRSPWLAATGIPALCEIETSDVPEWLGEADAHVVQVAESRREARFPRGVRVVAPDALVSARLRRDAMAGPVIVVSRDPALAYRFAAQLARAGAPRVAVLRSGLDEAAAGILFASGGRPASEG